MLLVGRYRVVADVLVPMQCDINIKDSIRQCVFHLDYNKIFFPVKIDIFKMYKICLDLNRVGHAVAD